MIRAEVNAVDFLKSILNVGNFTRKFKCNYYFINAEDAGPKPKIGMYGLRCIAKTFLQ